MKTKIYLFSLFIFISPLVSLAGGTVDFKEVELVINQRPKIADFLYPTLDFYHTAIAEVHVGHGSAMPEEYVGKRFGPYKLYAKPKGSQGPFIFQVIINTRYATEEDQIKMDEKVIQKPMDKFLSVEITELEKPFAPYDK
ncbi:MAG: hypothetical protein M0R48_06275 [Candidatus Omnitrophica bacterium]|nr:hypothetical protein [Candidatus Omnitrophota bacterium]